MVYNKDLNVLINHFDNYPLMTKKRADFELFKLAVELISRKEHLSLVGLNKIINIKASINKGLSEELQIAFPNINPFLRPIFDLDKIKNPNWLAGFLNAEGSFYIQIAKNTNNRSGYRVWLRFQITQHLRDLDLLKSFTEYLNCGGIYLKKNQEVGDFVVTRLTDISDKIVPFFPKVSNGRGKGIRFCRFLSSFKVN